MSNDYDFIQYILFMVNANVIVSVKRTTYSLYFHPRYATFSLRLNSVGRDAAGDDVVSEDVRVTAMREELSCLECNNMAPDACLAANNLVTCGTKV